MQLVAYSWIFSRMLDYDINILGGHMDDTETIDTQHVAPLQDDDIPDANQSHQCFSCSEDMSGIYCTACGNKNDNYRRSIWSLGLELFSSLTAFEGRIWRSLRSLIIKPRNYGPRIC